MFSHHEGQVQVQRPWPRKTQKCRKSCLFITPKRGDKQIGFNHMFGEMKVIVLKLFVGLFAAFADYYAYFLGSVELRFVGGRREPARDLFSRASKVSLVVLLLCAINLVFFLPTL
jgi:hypothetical protein